MFWLLAIWVSCNEVARQPNVFVWIPIYLPWESMAAHRTAWREVTKFCTQVQDSPISPTSQFQVASPTALAPPTGQICTCIHVYNFRPIHPIFTNQALLDSLNQAEFNAPYDVILPHDGFSAICVYVENINTIISILCTHDLQAMLDIKIWKIFQIQNRLAATANQSKKTIWRSLASRGRYN